jgi:predicted nucleic acid-binding protein
MEVVVDTSAVIAVIANEPEREPILDLTAGADVFAPESMQWEIGNAFVAMLRRRRMDLAQARLALRRYEQMPFRFMDIDLTQAIELAHQFNIYAYDAYVVACALNLRLPLITLDNRMIEVAPLAGVQIVEIDN